MIMEPKEFDKLIASMYNQTFTMDFMGQSFEFKKKLPAEESYNAKTGKSGISQETMMWRIVAELSVEPKLTKDQVAKLPEDFYTKVYLEYSDFLDPKVKDQAEQTRKQALNQMDHLQKQTEVSKT